MAVSLLGSRCSFIASCLLVARRCCRMPWTACHRATLAGCLRLAAYGGGAQGLHPGLERDHWLPLPACHRRYGGSAVLHGSAAQHIHRLLLRCTGALAAILCTGVREWIGCAYEAWPLVGWLNGGPVDHHLEPQADRTRKQKATAWVAYKDSCAIQGSRVGTGLGITDAG